MVLPLVLSLLVILFWPASIPKKPFSTIINDSKGALLSAQAAKDGQWRFPMPDSVPVRIQECIRYFEDEYFYYHPGINPVSLVRAAWKNATHNGVRSGASTLTMQIARMARGNRRTMLNKLDEMIMALKLDLLNSKQELMIQYASMAPFGGNVVGLEAASWRYFGRPPHLLSWAESATLAVLPNNPGDIFSGRQDSILEKKRNFLLSKLKDKKAISVSTYELSLLEPIPTSLPLPAKASQLLTTFSKSHLGGRLNSTLDPYWQSRVNDLAESHQKMMANNGVDNLAALVVDLSDGRILAYKGNTDNRAADGNRVDILQSRRSPGSSLKPLLFASAIDKGIIQRKTLLPDVPTFFGGFVPRNFNRGYVGVVPANVSLSRSLNIPMVHLMDAYSYEQFHQDLADWGITTLDQPAGHYGLTMILGGCEIKPVELAQVYFSMYRKLAGKQNFNIGYDQNLTSKESFKMGEDAIWQTFQTMTALARPEGEKAWRSFNSSQLIAWKTGTSHGFRDAWAVGLNGSVLVIVWVGNADGEGRADLTRIKAAAPLFHQIMRLSEYDEEWLQKMKPFMRTEKMCGKTGMLAGANCPVDKQQVTENAEKIGICTYHKELILDAAGMYRVTSDCYSLNLASRESRFILSPNQGHYYKKVFMDYEGLPPLHPNCLSNSNPIGIIYPNNRSKVFIPKEISGERGRAIFQATHQVNSEPIFWHVDEVYMGETLDTHEMPVMLDPGKHTLKLMDGSGNEVVRNFEVIGDD